jgi:hypothetical protein
MSETETISKPFRASEEQSSAPDNSSILDKFNGLFSNKNAIIIVLVFLLILLLVGINLLKIVGIILSDIADPLVPAFRSLLSMIGFTAGNIIKGSADVVANTSELGIDIAKGTTHSIGDILINSANPGIDTSKQIDLTDVVGVWNYPGSIPEPAPVQSTEPTVTPISTQKPKAGWCYVGEFSGARGCVEVTEHDKCMSGQIFASQAECLKPSQ